MTRHASQPPETEALISRTCPGRYRLEATIELESNGRIPVRVPLVTSFWLLGESDDAHYGDVEAHDEGAWFTKN